MILYLFRTEFETVNEFEIFMNTRPGVWSVIVGISDAH